jgi:hypothetical protein
MSHVHQPMNQMCFVDPKPYTVVLVALCDTFAPRLLGKSDEIASTSSSPQQCWNQAPSCVNCQIVMNCKPRSATCVKLCKICAIEDPKLKREHIDDTGPFPPAVLQNRDHHVSTTRWPLPYKQIKQDAINLCRRSAGVDPKPYSRVAHCATPFLQHCSADGTKFQKSDPSLKAVLENRRSNHPYRRSCPPHTPHLYTTRWSYDLNHNQP